MKAMRVSGASRATASHGAGLDDAVLEAMKEAKKFYLLVEGLAETVQGIDLPVLTKARVVDHTLQYVPNPFARGGSRIATVFVTVDVEIPGWSVEKYLHAAELTGALREQKHTPTDLSVEAQIKLLGLSNDVQRQIMAREDVFRVLNSVEALHRETLAACERVLDAERKTKEK